MTAEGIDKTARSTADKAHDRIDRLVGEVSKVASACAVLEGVTRMHIKACDEARENTKDAHEAMNVRFDHLDTRWDTLVKYVLLGAISIAASFLGIISTLKGWW